jgi:uncharacterized membrane protein YbhN (UPF0104 family)
VSPPADPVTEVQLFEPGPARRPFSAGDVVRLLLGLVLVAGGAVLAKVAQSTIEGIEADLLSAFARFPDGFEELLVSAAQLVTSVVPLVAAVVLLVRRRWSVALLLFLTGILASLAMNVAGALIIDRDLAALLERLGADDTRITTYPTSEVLASTTALVIVAVPWLSRRWKRALWGTVAILVALRLLAVAEPAFDIVVALGVGTVVGSLVLLVFGSPNNEPGPRELLQGLRAAGFDPRRIDRDDQPGTSSSYRFRDASQVSYGVTLRTPDERDADLLDRLYRGLRFRSSEIDVAYATLQRRIEHEALVLALAARAGVLAPDAVRIGTTEGGSAFLVTTAPLTQSVTGDHLRRSGVLNGLWAQVQRLHHAGLAHRRLALESLHVDEGGRAWLRGFDQAQTAASERERARDIAQLLTETAIVVGVEPAVDAAVAAMGPAAVGPAVRMLQPLALPPATRARAAAVDGLLDDLRTQVVRITGAEGLDLEDLERIKPRTVLLVVASTLAFYSLLPQLANLQDTVDAFGDAQPGWIAAAVLASILTYLFAALSFQGAVADPMPFVPNLRAQLASSFAGLVGPAGAGGFALTVRFLQRVGVRPAEAGASVAVNAVAGFAVHLTLLVAFVVWSGRSGLDGFSLPDSTTLLLALAGLLALVGVLLSIAPVRRRLAAPLWASVTVGVGQIGRVFRSPARVAALFGGSTGISLAYVTAAFCAVVAFGGGLSFPQVGAAYLGAVALATLAPTPGGLGALESAMIAGLTGFGLDAGAAVSATLTFRMATFWLPILPGWAVLRWMERNDEL